MLLINFCSFVQGTTSGAVLRTWSRGWNRHKGPEKGPVQVLRRNAGETADGCGKGSGEGAAQEGEEARGKTKMGRSPLVGEKSRGDDRTRLANLP